MGFFGLSILIASVTFLCYRHPPSTWIALLRQQMQPAALQEKSHFNRSETEAPDSDTSTRSDSAKNDTPTPKVSQEPSAPTIAVEAPQINLEGLRDAAAAKAESDRKEMPPPPFKKPAIPARTTPAAQAPAVPSFHMHSADNAPTDSDSDSDTTSPTVPSFPALHSAQRASGGLSAPRSAPPRVQPPLRSAGLMSPPARGPLPNRGPPGASGFSLAPPPTHSAVPTKPRKKVLLTPGHSPLDWARLSASPTANLRGLPADTPYLRVPPSLLKQYTGRKGKDAWTVLGGKVYNMTPYLPYHPGGEPELMKAAGRDGTKLFGEVHPWVNWEGMLEGCLVGIAVEEADVPDAKGSLEDMD